jgi:hypothetical protein
MSRYGTKRCRSQTNPFKGAIRQNALKTPSEQAQFYCTQSRTHNDVLILLGNVNYGAVLLLEVPAQVADNGDSLHHHAAHGRLNPVPVGIDGGREGPVQQPLGVLHGGTRHGQKVGPDEPLPRLVTAERARRELNTCQVRRMYELGNWILHGGAGRSQKVGPNETLPHL